jgi:hypothetical protein
LEPIFIAPFRDLSISFNDKTEEIRQDCEDGESNDLSAQINYITSDNKER